MTFFESETYPKVLGALNVVMFAVQATINALAGVGTIGVKPTGVISDDNPTRIVPDGYAFSIWGVIYTFQAIFAVYTCTATGRADRRNTVGVSFLFALMTIINITWICVWGYEHIVGSTVVMVLYLLTLIYTYQRASVDYLAACRESGEMSANKYLVPSKAQDDDEDDDEHHMESSSAPTSTLSKIYPHFHYADAPWGYWIIAVSLSILLGWISVATVVNIAAAAVHDNPHISPAVQSQGSAAMQTVLAALTLIMLRTRGDFVFAGVAVWALAAIAVKQKEHLEVAFVAVCMATLLGAALLWTVVELVRVYLKARTSIIRNHSLMESGKDGHRAGRGTRRRVRQERRRSRHRAHN